MPINATGPFNAKVMLVGEFPHEQDLLRGEPFVGGPGYELTKMMQEAGLHRNQCRLTMVMKDRVIGNRISGLIAEAKKDITPAHVFYNGKWVLPRVMEAVEALKAEILLHRPNVVCALGNLAMWALTGEWSVNAWRSSIMESTLVPGLKVIPTLSPAVVMQVWSNRPLIVHDLKRVKRHENNPVVTRPDYRFLIRPSFEQARDALQELLKKCHEAGPGKFEIGADIETRAGHIACIAFAWSDLDAVCIPLMCAHDPEGYWTADQEATLVHLMYQILTTAHVIGQNWNYDEQYIHRHWHLRCPTVTDTMIQFHSCFSNLPKNLAFLSAMFLEDHYYWKDDRTNWTEGPKGEGEDVYWRYNCTDAVRTFSIKRVLDSVISQMGLQEVNTVQQRLRVAALNTMIKGVRIAHERRAEFAMELQSEVAVREAWLQEVLGHELNIRSSKQMQDFFYHQMAQKPVINRKSGNVSCDDEALRKIASREPILLPVVKKIAELRSLGVFHSTFVEAPLDIDRRMRCTFNVAGTETYRFASSKNAFGTGMNMQNVPKGGELEDDGLELPNIRKLFIPDPGHTMFDIDLDSADLRIVTWESDCQWMKDHFKNGRKPYVEVMREYYHNPTMDKKSHPREYAIFKSLCHGTNYLGTADGIAPRIGLLVHETERIQNWYFGMCPEIKAWQEEIKKQVMGRRYVQNAFGYRNYFFDRIEGTIFNQAVAWIPQSTVVCLINRAWINIEDNLPEVEVLIQVHDSLVGQFDSLHGDWALRRILEEADVAIPYDDPLHIPVGIVNSKLSWGDCE